MIIIRGTILEAGTEDTSITPLLFFSLCLLTDLGMPHYHRLSTLTLICLSWVLSKTLVQLCVTVAANPLVKTFGEFGTVLMIRKCLFMYYRHYANNEVKSFSYNTWNAHALFHFFISFILFFSLFSTAVLHRHLWSRKRLFTKILAQETNKNAFDKLSSFESLYLNRKPMHSKHLYSNIISL